MIRQIGILACIAALLGCSENRGRPRIERAGVAVVPDSIALDSCEKLDRLAVPQRRVLLPGETVPHPHPGSWSEVKRLSLGAVSIEVPSVTTVGRTDSMFLALLDFPTCRYFCAISIALVHDSLDRSLDAYVASLRIVDSVADPDADRDRPGPPRPIGVGPDRGLIMDTPCGDCGSSDIVVRRGETVAHIDLNIDDREGYQPGVMCRLARAATTFRWIDPHATISLRP